MTQATNFNVEYYKDLALRRKWWIICPFVVSLIIGLVCVKVIPKTFRANTLILVQPQKIPDSYVNPTVTESVQSRLHTISQQIYSRTNLEGIIDEFDLEEASNRNDDTSTFDLIEVLRRKIKIDIRQRDKRAAVQAFDISFEWHDPKIAADVTNALASQFIEENLKVREAMAMGTTAFLTNEAIKIKGSLEEHEKAVEEFKKKYMGMLPDQLEANINILGQLKEQLSSVEMRLMAEQDKATFLQRQTEILRATQSVNGQSEDPAVVAITRLNALKQQLEELGSKYTERHPDVVALKRDIAALEGKLQAQQDQTEAKETTDQESAAQTQSAVSGPLVGLSRQAEALTVELEGANRSIGLYKKEAKKIKKQIVLYKERIERTPEVELELTKVTRDYATIRDRYDSLLNKKIDAGLAEQLERRQKGEQFKVIDPAIAPKKPVKPDVRKIMLIALLAGLGLGCGLAYLIETMRGTFYNTDDVEDFLETKVLVSIPFVKGAM